MWACVDTVDTLAVGLDLLIAAQTDSDTKGRPERGPVSGPEANSIHSLPVNDDLLLVVLLLFLSYSSLTHIRLSRLL